MNFCNNKKMPKSRYSFGPRLLNHIETLGLEPKKVSFGIEMDWAGLYKILKGHTLPEDATLLKFASYEPLGIDYYTLKGWQLEDRVGHNPLPTMEDIIKRTYDPKTLIESASDNAKFYLKLLDDFKNTPHHEHDQQETASSFPAGGPLIPVQGPIKAVPIIGLVSAGTFTPAKEVEGGLGVAYYVGDIPGNVICLQISGDSMEPKFPNGAAVFCLELKGPKLKNGKEYIVQLENGDTTFKIVQLSEDGLILHPLNPSHKAIAVKSATIIKAWEVLASYMDYRRF